MGTVPPEPAPWTYRPAVDVNPRFESQQDIIASARRGLLKNPSPQQEQAYREIIEQTRIEIRRVRDQLK
jgi:hypothetical protein